MKLFKKKDKTNNSLMTLLKKLKRHDTMVVAIAVVIAVLLCGGLIYISTPVVAAEAKEKFIESERENNELTKEKLQEIRDYLDELDKVVTSNRESLNSLDEKTSSSKDQDLFNESLKENSKELHSQSQQIKSDTQKIIVETEKITSTISEKVTALDGKLSEVHKDITNTNTKIEEFKSQFQEINKKDAEEIKKNFEQVNKDLEKIQKEYEEATKQAKDLNAELSKNLDGKYTDLLAKLDEMYKNMEAFNTSAFEGFRNDINELSNNLTRQIEDIDQDIRDYSTTVNNKFDEMNTSVSNKFDTVNNKFETINNNVVTDIDELRKFIQGEMNDLNGQLQLVFQSVSDGKKLLASTLLTKGVHIKEDASFVEISKAIESIESKVIIEKLEGTVVYDRHYHTGKDGERIDETVVGIDQMGGCFTTPVYHKHVSSCYRTTSHLVFSTDSGTYAVSPAGEINGVSAWNYKCSHCGASFRGTNGWHNESASSMAQVNARGGQNARTVYDTSIICGKNNSTIDGYSPSCGYLIGQILAAHIDYSGNKNISPEAAASIGTSHMAVSSSQNLVNRALLDLDGLFAEFGIENGHAGHEEHDLHIHEGGNFFDENCPDCIKNDATDKNLVKENGSQSSLNPGPDPDKKTESGNSGNPAGTVNGAVTGCSEGANGNGDKTSGDSKDNAGNNEQNNSGKKSENNTVMNSENSTGTTTGNITASTTESSTGYSSGNSSDGTSEEKSDKSSSEQSGEQSGGSSSSQENDNNASDGSAKADNNE